MPSFSLLQPQFLTGTVHLLDISFGRCPPKYLKGRLMLRLSHINPHTPRGTFNNLHRRVNAICVQVGHFLSAISRTCAGHFADFARGILARPFFNACRFNEKRGRGGVFIMKENVRSSYTEISTGTMSPILSRVFSLNSATNCPMFTPACPSAGPKGGAGVAFPLAPEPLFFSYFFGHIISSYYLFS